MLLVVFWRLLFNEYSMYWHIGYATIYESINYHIQEYYEVYTLVTCQFIVENFFTYTSLAPPTLFGIHGYQTTLMQML